MENTPAEPAPPQTPHPAIDAHKRGLELLKANQASAAVDAFSKAIAIRPEWPRPYLNRGRAYQKQGDYNAAIRDYGQVLRMQPNNAYAHALRGMAYLRLKDDAASCCRKARFSSRSWLGVLNIEASAPSTLNRCCCADRRSKRKLINFNDCRSIGIFWRDRGQQNQRCDILPATGSRFKER